MFKSIQLLLLMVFPILLNGQEYKLSANGIIVSYRIDSMNVIHTQIDNRSPQDIFIIPQMVNYIVDERSTIAVGGIYLQPTGPKLGVLFELKAIKAGKSFSLPPMPIEKSESYRFCFDYLESKRSRTPTSKVMLSDKYMKKANSFSFGRGSK